MRKCFLGASLVLTIGLFGVIVAPSAIATTTKKISVSKYSNKLSNNDNGWCTDTPYSSNNDLSGCDGAASDYGTITPRAENSNAGGYAAAVAPPTGSKNYSRVSGALNPSESNTGCGSPGGENCTGPFVLFGHGANAGNENAFPRNGWTSSVKLYLDTNWAEANPGQIVDWDTAANLSTLTNATGAGSYYFEDFIFNLCSAAGGWSVNASNNAGGCTTGSPGAVTIGTSGWYTFTHVFFWNDDALMTDYSVTNSSGNVVFSWSESTTSAWNGSETVALTSPTQLGGPNYGWLPDEDVLGLPIADLTVHKNTVQP